MGEEIAGSRRTLRLQDYDYGQSGAYFVTLCTEGRRIVFGDVRDGAVRLNELGRAVETAWLSTPLVRDYVQLDAHVVMPNHLHGIIVFHSDREATPVARHKGLQSQSETLGAVIRGFKAASTRMVNDVRRLPGATVWQRGYYEHIIRTERDLNAIREYIVNNPAKWAEDTENPHRVKHTRM